MQMLSLRFILTEFPENVKGGNRLRATLCNYLRENKGFLHKMRIAKLYIMEKPINM